MQGPDQKVSPRMGKAARSRRGSSAFRNVPSTTIAHKMHDFEILTPGKKGGFEGTSSNTCSEECLRPEESTDFSILDTSDNHHFIAVRERGIYSCADVDSSIRITVRLNIQLEKESVVTSAHGRLPIGSCFQQFIPDEAAQHAHLIGVRFPRMREENALDSLSTQFAPLSVNLANYSLSVPLSKLVILCMETNLTRQKGQYRILVYEIHLVTTEASEDVPRFRLQINLKWMSDPLLSVVSNRFGHNMRIDENTLSGNTESNVSNRAGSSDIAFTVFSDCSNKQNLLINLLNLKDVGMSHSSDTIGSQNTNTTKGILVRIHVRNDGTGKSSRYIGSSSSVFVDKFIKSRKKGSVRDYLFTGNHMEVPTSAYSLSCSKSGLDPPVCVTLCSSSQNAWHSQWGCQKCTYISTPLKDNLSQAKFVIYGVLSSKGMSTIFVLVEAKLETEKHPYYLIIAWGTPKHCLCDCRRNSFSGFSVVSPALMDVRYMRKANSTGYRPNEIFLVTEVTRDLPQTVRRFLEKSKNSCSSIVQITENVAYLSEPLKFGVIRSNYLYDRISGYYRHYTFLMELERSVYLAQLIVSCKSLCEFTINKISFGNSKAESAKGAYFFSLNTGLLLRSALTVTPDLIKRRVQIWIVGGLLGRSIQATLGKKYRTTKPIAKKRSMVSARRSTLSQIAGNLEPRVSEITEEKQNLHSSIVLLPNFDAKAETLLQNPMFSLIEDPAEKKISFENHFLSSVHQITVSEECSRNLMYTKITEGIHRCSIAEEEQSVRERQILEELSQLRHPDSNIPTVSTRQSTASLSDVTHVDNLHYSVSRQFHEDIDRIFQYDSTQSDSLPRTTEICMMERAERLKIQLERHSSFGRVIGACETLRFLSESP